MQTPLANKQKYAEKLEKLQEVFLIYSQEIIQAYKRRIQEVNPIINAVVEDRFAEALVEAKKIDKYLDENPDKTEEIKSTKPFFGIPITIKESIAVKGMSYTGASLTRKNIKADKDSIVVRRLKEAGLIPLLVSNTPEYCSCIETYNKIIGYTYNPYNTLYTAGGSSEVKGALLGASASLIGVGSDICGSIRVPAIFNGVFGHKTKIVPLDGHWPMLDDDLYRNYLIIGPMARYAEDLKPLLKIMSGPNAHTLNLDEEVDFRKIKIYYMEDTGNDFCLPNVQKEIKTAVKAATAYLSRECHCHVSTRKFKEFSESLEISGVNMMDIDPFPSPLNDTSATYLALPNLLGLPATAVPTGFDANKLPVGIQIYSQEIVQSYKNRIQEVNPIINAVIEDRFEEALEEAKQLDRFLDENPDKINEIKNSKPFYGIPITIKESLAVKGKLDLEKVLNIKKGVKADKDSVVVQRLKEAGLIPLLVSSTPEYYGSLETYNKLIGYTYNPYNTLYTCGGSSGGEGALLASAASVIGIGSDIGGSIRIPAAFNGVFGHKPSSKTASLEGHWPIEHDDTYQNYLTIGPMTRYAEDLAPLLKIISGANAQKLKLDEQVDLSKIQIFYMEDTGNDFGLPKVEKEIKNSIKVAASYLSRECHCHVSKTKFKELSESLEISSIHIMGLKNIPSPLYDTDDALGDNGVLIYPCTQNSAFKLGGYFIGFATSAYLALPNILGLPATAVPTGFDAKKMPIGIQISSEEVVLAYIKRIKEVNPIINAVVEDRFTEALAEAKKVDEYLNRYNAANLDLENVKPLLGVPITVKESIAVKAMSFTGCSLTRKGVKAKEDAEAVTLLKEAGAIILLVSSTPEYCAAIETYNNVIGRSKNPYDTRCGCGGSSGGEGALIGSGASVLGLGSDIAGSIRIPCAFNGIYGHKPTSGIVPLIGNLPWCDDERFCEYLAVGPMARYVEDLKLTMKVLAGLSYTGCSLSRKGIKAHEDAEAVSLLKKAGAIILLVSSTPEYCAATETYNNIIGRSKNPYDTRYGCGGSSGGEGALIGAGGSIVGIGTDMCGSIRIPCAFNGIYGHKPTSDSNEFGLNEVNPSIKDAINQAVTYLNKKFKCTINTTKFSEMQYTFAMSALVYRLNNRPDVFTDSEIKYNVWKELLKCFMGKSIFPICSHLFSITSNVNFLLSEEELEFYSKKMEELKEKFIIKSETIIKTYISRINSVNGILNAVVEDRYLDAIEEAKQVDILLNQPNIDIEKFAIQKPLLGVPVTIKESCAMKDLSLSVGFTFMKGTKAKEDGAAVSKLRKAGAIPLLVSTTSELCLSISCETLINGTTRNPYNTNCTSGGSSGGEGALIGSGSSLIGIGSDLGGSVRIPAMFNCIFGHKPTARLIPCEGHWPTCHDLKFYDYITIGPLARYAGDLKLMMKILSVSDKVNFDEEVNLKDINIFFTEDIGFFLGSNSVQVEIKQAVRDAVNYLHETYNMHISNEKIDKFDTVGESFISELLGIDDIIRPLQDPNNPDVKYTMMGQLVKGVFSKPNITMTNVLADVFIIRGNGFIPKSHTEKHRLNMEQLRDKMIHFLQKNGILIMPTFPTSAFHSVEIAWHMINASVFTGILNILGFPSTQVPMGFDRKGMPIGVQITCVEVVKAYIDRVKEVNPIINAVVEERFSHALKDAEVVDKTIANNEFNQDYIKTKYPLLGVPLTVKECCQVEGLSFCIGSKKRIGLKTDTNGRAIQKLREAGAIPLLVSNTPEISLAWETNNLVIGRTLNPYNTGRTSGGSSGGEGALLGAGASVIGVGSDIAGSIRIPALFNGIFGHKPTPKVISIEGNYPVCPDKQFADFLVLGPLTRYAEDLKLMMKVMCENPNELSLDKKVDLDKLKIFWMYKAEKSMVLPSVDQDIKTIINKCLDHLKMKYGCCIDDYKFDMRETCEMSASLIYKMEDIPNVLKDPITSQETNNLYLELLKAFFGCSNYSLHGLYFYFLQKHNTFVSRNKYNHYREQAKLLKNDLIEKLADNGILLYPTFPIPAVEHDKTLLLTAGVMYTMIFNALGLPSTHVPLGINRNGLPIGIQVIASPYQDRLCLRIAEELEKHFGGWIEP
ncbi:fatty-acid amide hydrolase [Holotrichia oblita]|uniref:Fatty-acid amide hydrolase n=1 Tax=Holotrichia oblita TaxID=644536 RepID=A0ACB9SUK4_HOLOL|nr:fatty-acid amide hydrolase [Holotrichia oblita]